MLQLVFVEAALELVPPEILGHPSVRRNAKRRGKRPEETLLDRSLHHFAMDRLPDSEKRGRPDIIHFCLLEAMGSPLNRAGLLRVWMSTRDGRLVEFYLEETDTAALLGNIYKARVVDVLPGMNAAFVDIGLMKNAFLFINDILPGLFDSSLVAETVEEPEEIDASSAELAQARITGAVFDFIENSLFRTTVEDKRRQLEQFN